MFCTSGSNLVILTRVGDNETVRSNPNWWCPHRQTQATTIPEGQNWPRVKRATSPISSLGTVHYHQVLPPASLMMSRTRSDESSQDTEPSIVSGVMQMKPILAVITTDNSRKTPFFISRHYHGLISWRLKKCESGTECMKNLINTDSGHQ